MKTIMFLLFLAMVWCALMQLGSLAAVIDGQNLPFESLETAKYVNSYSFQMTRRDLVDAIYNEKDITQHYSYKELPAFYFRAEYPDGHVLSNAPQENYNEFFRGQGLYIVRQTDVDGRWTTLEGNEEYYRYDYSNTAEVALSDSEPFVPFTIWLGFDEQALTERQTYWQQCRSYLIQQMAIIWGLALIGIAAAFWLLITCGRKSSDRELHLLRIDSIWTEVLLVAFWGACALPFLPSLLWFEQIGNGSFYQDKLLNYLAVTATALLTGLALLLAMSLVRLIKGRRFIRNSLTFKILHWCWRPFGKLIDMLRSCFDERAFPNNPPAKRMVKRFGVFMAALYGTAGIVLLFSLMVGEVGTFFLILLIGLAALPLAYWHLKGLKASCEQLLTEVQESHTQQVRSESTKTELITNVSHDLKTPLTSIITYVELLQKEELSDTARDYVAILAQKSERLKVMVSDLFDLSKSTSGNLPIEAEPLDMKRLLEQTLADMQDGISQSGLNLKTQFPVQPLYIYSDGKKLYRVFQNLIGNAFKYGMPGTRVFVTLEENGSMAVASIKNTASYEMDFTPEEILQRFTRGDKSRAGEGSGLGLSIAESFTTACGGQFKLEIDGDFFKITVSMPLTDLRPEESPIADPVPTDPAPKAPASQSCDTKTVLASSASGSVDSLVP